MAETTDLAPEPEDVAVASGLRRPILIAVAIIAIVIVALALFVFLVPADLLPFDYAGFD